MTRQDRKTEPEELAPAPVQRVSFARLQERMVGFAKTVVQAADLDLIEARMHGGRGGGRKIQLFIERLPGRGGVIIEECASVSRKLRAVFELEDPVLAEADLEVSSPGINRLLRNADDMRQFIGIRARATINERIDADRETVIGLITGCDERALVLELENNSSRVIPLADIGRATLDPTHEQWLELGSKMSAERAEAVPAVDADNPERLQEDAMSQGDER